MCNDSVETSAADHLSAKVMSKQTPDVHISSSDSRLCFSF